MHFDLSTLHGADAQEYGLKHTILNAVVKVIALAAQGCDVKARWCAHQWHPPDIADLYMWPATWSGITITFHTDW